MPKARRKENKGLPARWTIHHGAYYYYVPKGQEAHWQGKKKFKLGDSLSEAYAKFAEMVDVNKSIRTIGQLLDRYLLEVVPTKAAATQVGNRAFIKKLRAVFSEVDIKTLVPRNVYQYVDGRTAKVSAHREIEILSHAYTKAVEWGLVDRHPFLGQVRLEGEAPRERYVEDWETVEFFKPKSKRKKGSVHAIHAYAKIKLLTGLPRGDLLRLNPSVHFTPEGIDVTRHKKQKKKKAQRRIYSWDLTLAEDLRNALAESDPDYPWQTMTLRDAVNDALAARPVDISPFLFCTNKGEGYMDETTGEPPGFKSMWQRYMARVLNETEIKEPFTDHDIRAKVGSDAETLERAVQLLAHADPRTTERIYRRKVVKVSPMK